MPCYLSVRKPNVRERVKVSRKYGKRSLKNIIVLRYTVSAPFSAIPPPPLPLPSTFLPVLFHVCERIDKGKTSKVNQNTKALLAGDNFACIPFSNFSHPYRQKDLKKYMSGSSSSSQSQSQSQSQSSLAYRNSRKTVRDNEGTRNDTVTFEDLFPRVG